MLKKNAASALILSTFFFAALVVGYQGLVYVVHPMHLSAAPVGYLIYLVVTFGLLIFLFSKGSMVMGLTEQEGFGVPGLLRWMACGILIGILLSVWNEILIPILHLNKTLEFPFQLVGLGGAFLIGYQVVFHHNLLKMARAGELPGAEAWRNLYWAFIIGGLFVLAFSWFNVFIMLGKNADLT